jgi:hypothetical protein
MTINNLDDVQNHTATGEYSVLSNCLSAEMFSLGACASMALPCHV